MKEDEKAKEKARKLRQGGEETKQHRILVVDNEPDFIKTVKEALGGNVSNGRTCPCEL